MSSESADDRHTLRRTNTQTLIVLSRSEQLSDDRPTDRLVRYERRRTSGDQRSNLSIFRYPLLHLLF